MSFNAMLLCHCTPNYFFIFGFYFSKVLKYFLLVPLYPIKSQSIHQVYAVDAGKAVLNSSTFSESSFIATRANPQLTFVPIDAINNPMTTFCLPLPVTIYFFKIYITLSKQLSM
eukprot:Em0004g819a